MTTVYTLPSCVQCDATKRFLTKNGLPYDTVDLSTDSKAYEYIKGLGFSAAPVVVTSQDSWSGFQPDRLSMIAA
jgi:glutaredoxin-like protein NrdH